MGFLPRMTTISVGSVQKLFSHSYILSQISRDDITSLRTGFDTSERLIRSGIYKFTSNIRTRLIRLDAEKDADQQVLRNRPRMGKRMACFVRRTAVSSPTIVQRVDFLPCPSPLVVVGFPFSFPLAICCLESPCAISQASSLYFLQRLCC